MIKKIIKALNIRIAFGYNETQMVDLSWNKIEEINETDKCIKCFPVPKTVK